AGPAKANSRRHAPGARGMATLPWTSCSERNPDPRGESAATARLFFAIRCPFLHMSPFPDAGRGGILTTRNHRLWRSERGEPPPPRPRAGGEGPTSDRVHAMPHLRLAYLLPPDLEDPFVADLFAAGTLGVQAVAQGDGRLLLSAWFPVGADPELDNLGGAWRE